jgi:hypothetical protein
MSIEPERTARKAYVLAPTDVSFADYWLEWLLLLASVGAPVFVCLVYRNADLFARSGALMVFFAAAAEFVTLNRSNRKHLLNACRAKDGETPRDFSAASKLTGWLSFLFALAGTIIWAYGDKFHVA